LVRVSCIYYIYKKEGCSDFIQPLQSSSASTWIYVVRNNYTPKCAGVRVNHVKEDAFMSKKELSLVLSTSMPQRVHKVLINKDKERSKVIEVVNIDSRHKERCIFRSNLCSLFCHRYIINGVS
jgi:hypothetical protein